MAASIRNILDTLSYALCLNFPKLLAYRCGVNLCRVSATHKRPVETVWGNEWEWNADRITFVRESALGFVRTQNRYRSVQYEPRQVLPWYRTRASAVINQRLTSWVIWQACSCMTPVSSFYTWSSLHEKLLDLSRLWSSCLCHRMVSQAANSMCE
jgi:hypothetical protein